MYFLAGIQRRQVAQATELTFMAGVITVMNMQGCDGQGDREDHCDYGCCNLPRGYPTKYSEFFLPGH